MSRSSLFLKSTLGLLLATVGLAISAPSHAASTYYVRTDGGSAQQCTGRADAPYPGSGSDQACAWSSPHYALPADGPTRIQGGDTLIIGPGDYMIGWGAPGADGGRCYSGGPYDCYLPPIPSGPSASARTRILGKGYNTGCKAPPTLWGNERVEMVLNLDGSDNVEIGCLEITDRSDCVENHSNAGAECERDNPPYGRWASIGIRSEYGSSNVWLHDLDIHGLAHTGIRAGGLSDWTLERVKINANGWIGWDGDLGDGSSNSGDIVLREVEIAWNGCGERWQSDTPWACWAQQTGGYGDGLGTDYTGGDWLIVDSFIHHNTSDGLDLLYLDGKPGTSVTVRRLRAVANAGNQVKTNGAALIENSVIIGSCAWFEGQYFMVDGDQCRAMGNTISVSLASGQTTTIRHNTITGQGDCLIMSEGGDSSATLEIRNNALVGKDDYNSGGSQLTCGHYSVDDAATVSYSGNLLWNVKNGQCPPGNNLCGRNPMLAGMGLADFDATPLAGSPLVDSAPTIAAVTSDFLLQPRPYGAGPDIGAIELQPAGSNPPPNPDPEPDPDPYPWPDSAPPKSDPLPARRITPDTANLPAATVGGGPTGEVDDGYGKWPSSTGSKAVSGARSRASQPLLWNVRSWLPGSMGPDEGQSDARSPRNRARPSEAAPATPVPATRSRALEATQATTAAPVPTSDRFIGAPRHAQAVAGNGAGNAPMSAVAPTGASGLLRREAWSQLRAPSIRILLRYANTLY